MRHVPEKIGKVQSRHVDFSIAKVQPRHVSLIVENSEESILFTNTR